MQDLKIMADMLRYGDLIKVLTADIDNGFAFDTNQVVMIHPVTLIAGNVMQRRYFGNEIVFCQHFHCLIDSGERNIGIIPAHRSIEILGAGVAVISQEYAINCYPRIRDMNSRPLSYIPRLRFPMPQQTYDNYSGLRITLDLEYTKAGYQTQ